jgi:hypothetical protein
MIRQVGKNNKGCLWLGCLLIFISTKINYISNKFAVDF